MTQTKLLYLSLLLLLPLIVFSQAHVVYARSITVCASGCDYALIQDAIETAAPHDTLDVAAGTYPEHLSLYDKQLTIHGADAATTVLDGGNDGRVLFLYANTALTLTNVTVRNGRIADNQGGGIYSDGVLTLDASRVMSNSASVSGGGIANFGVMVISNSVITDNDTYFGNGGGIVNGGQLTVTASTIAGNHAQTRGGGIYHSVGVLTLANSTVTNNYGDFAGGGIANFDRMSSVNSTISGNFTEGAGGGILNGGRLAVVNLTVADNHAGDGNSLYNSGTLTATNTIMTDGAIGKNCTNWGIVNSLGANLERAANCGFTAANDLQNRDPLLAPLADNGGATPTHALLLDSPALDTGNNCPPPATDQRGLARPSGAKCDIGAFEAGEGAAAPFTWPTWARTARIAGAYFAPDESDAAIDARLDELAAQQVSVVLADSPWGEKYAVWADDDQFVPVKNLIAKVVEKAHARGLKVVMYQTGLELLSDPERNPGLEYPEWAQKGLNGTPLLYNDISNEDEHWLNKGIWDFWVSPCAFQTHSLARVQDVVATGIDGLWVDQVYLQSSIGTHDDLWPSSDACSAAAFTHDTKLEMPVEENWDDSIFQRWIVWRHKQIADFLLAEKAAARAVNPNLVFFNENSSVDAGRPTYVANDPASYLTYSDMSTGHEVETIADRMDEGETGMKSATLDQWLALRTMIAFARGVDVGKPSWILTYGYEPRDSAQLAGFTLAEGANFYETKGPQMADTAGVAYRTQLFQWIADHERALYQGTSAAEVGLLYSPRTRDLVDTVSGEPYDVQDSVHFAAYRTTANLLYRAHIPFDIVIDTNTTAFSHYHVLIAPEIQALANTTLTALEEFTGTLLTTGETGLYNEWLQDRPAEEMAALHPVHFAAPDENLVDVANTHLLTTTAPASIQIGLRQQVDGYALVIVNTMTTTTPAFTIELRVASQPQISATHLSTLDGVEVAVPFSLADDQQTLHLRIPAGIETVALLTVTTGEVQPNGSDNEVSFRLWLPQIID
ncbi:MAG: choice-of-anchor Q domain-containing protein [Caldilineaceae bacterium]